MLNTLRTVSRVISEEIVRELDPESLPLWAEHPEYLDDATIAEIERNGLRSLEQANQVLDITDLRDEADENPLFLPSGLSVSFFDCPLIFGVRTCLPDRARTRTKIELEPDTILAVLHFRPEAAIYDWQDTWPGRIDAEGKISDRPILLGVLLDLAYLNSFFEKYGEGDVVPLVLATNLDMGKLLEQVGFWEAKYISLKTRSRRRRILDKGQLRAEHGARQFWIPPFALETGQTSIIQLIQQIVQVLDHKVVEQVAVDLAMERDPDQPAMERIYSFYLQLLRAQS